MEQRICLAGCVLESRLQSKGRLLSPKTAKHGTGQHIVEVSKSEPRHMAQMHLPIQVTRWRSPENQFFSSFFWEIFTDRQINARHLFKKVGICLWTTTKYILLLWASYISLGGDSDEGIRKCAMEASRKVSQNQGQVPAAGSHTSLHGHEGCFYGAWSWAAKPFNRELLLIPMFSICKTEIMISVFRCFEFQGWKIIPAVNAKLFSLKHESSLGFLILSHCESCVLQ